MINVMQQQIARVFKDLNKLKNEGIWFSGYFENGVFKKWKNGFIVNISNFKNKKRHGKFIFFSDTDGKKLITRIYRNNKFIKEISHQ